MHVNRNRVFLFNSLLQSAGIYCVVLMLARFKCGFNYVFFQILLISFTQLIRFAIKFGSHIKCVCC